MNLYNFLITYQKQNGDTVKRNLFYNFYKIGDKNNFGWTVVEIQRLYYDQYVTLETFESLLLRDRILNEKRNKKFFNKIKKSISHSKSRKSFKT